MLHLSSIIEKQKKIIKAAACPKNFKGSIKLKVVSFLKF